MPAGLSSTLAENEDGKTYLVAGNSNKETYNVSVLGNGSVKCNCRGFKFTKVRSHSVAVSEKEGMLRNYVVKVKGSHSRSAATYPLNAKGSGRKRVRNVANDYIILKNHFKEGMKKMHRRTRSPKYGTTTIH